MEMRPKIHSIDAKESVMAEILNLGLLCQDTKDIHRVLDLLVEKIAHIMSADVCSLYIVEPKTHELVLRASKGLNKAAVDRVRLKPSEGLVGKTLEWQRPVSISMAKRSKSFKYIPETGEEQYSSFLSVPLIYNRLSVGVLVVQNSKAREYSKAQIHLLMSLGIPTVSVIERAKLIGTLDQLASGAGASPFENRQREISHENMMMQGIGASPGIAIAPVTVIRRKQRFDRRSVESKVHHPEIEKVRVLEAFRWVEEEIKHIQEKAQKKLGLEELSIFEAYSMVLQSEPFKEQILAEINNGLSALQSVDKVIAKYADELSQAEDEYLRERTYDIEDVGRKITDHLLFGSDLPQQLTHIQDETILASEYWSISDFVEMDIEKVKGILCTTGGATSHIAILVESLNLPAVLGLSNLMETISDGDRVILDGSSGVVMLHPSDAVVETYKKEAARGEVVQQRYVELAQKTIRPKGGKRITVGANLGMVAHLERMHAYQADYIGLYRTEFPFLIRRNLPTEEEQVHLYEKIVDSAEGKVVTFRTLDIGGDKYLPYLKLPQEVNPFLGWRSIRISLDRPDLFKIQLRAFYRAAQRGRVRILFPMISSVEEIKRVKSIVKDIKTELRAQDIKIPARIPIGIMIEVPAAAEMASALIREVDFFSIGTNDLTQYTLAVDRNNQKVAKLFSPFHPAVLRTIARVSAVAHRARKPVGVCGEMAAHPFGAALIIGMKIVEMSMSVPQIPRIKSLILSLDQREVSRLTKKVLKMDDTNAILGELERFFVSHDLQEYLPHGAVK